MFKLFSVALGAICIVAGIAMGFNEFAGIAVVLVGLSVTLLVGFAREFMREDEQALRAPCASIGLMIIAAGIGVMPMDGSWLLFTATAAFSLLLAWIAAGTVYDLRADLSDAASLRDINRIAAAFCLPIAGLSMVRYLVETDRSVASGLIVVAGLAWLGYKAMPRAVVRIARQRACPAT